MALCSDAAKSESRKLLSKEAALAMHCVFELPLHDGNQTTGLFLLEVIWYVWEAFESSSF